MGRVATFLVVSKTSGLAKKLVGAAGGYWWPLGTWGRFPGLCDALSTAARDANVIPAGQQR